MGSERKKTESWVIGMIGKENLNSRSNPGPHWGGLRESERAQGCTGGQLWAICAGVPRCCGKSLGFGVQRSWVLNALTCSVILRKWFGFPEPQFLYMG